MSLDVYLELNRKIKKKKGSGIFIREDGKTVEISEEEFRKRFPNKEPIRIIDKRRETNEVFSANITHNMGEMAEKAGLYIVLWRPEEKGWIHAKDIIEPLEIGLTSLEAKPEFYKRFNSPNGWGDYEGLLAFTKEYLEACKKYPNAKIRVWR